MAVGVGSYRLRERSRFPFRFSLETLSSWCGSGNPNGVVGFASIYGGIKDNFETVWFQRRVEVGCGVGFVYGCFKLSLALHLSFRLHHFVTSLRSSLVLRPLLYWSRAPELALFVLLLTRVDCLRGTLPFLRFSKTARDVTTLSLGGGVSLGFSYHPDAGEGSLDSSLASLAFMLGDDSGELLFGWEAVSSAVWRCVQLGFGGICKAHGMYPKPSSTCRLELHV
ncbi:Uncharacterized protein Rs2_46819 [Raphanus sativus]|nr:Uncharacterized protein Rs2_46819 [Raphanus sativus]